MIRMLLRILFCLLDEITCEEIICDALRVRINQRESIFSYARLQRKLKNNKPYRNIFFWRVDNALQMRMRQQNGGGIIAGIKCSIKHMSLKGLIIVFKRVYPQLETIEISVLDRKIGKGIYLPHRYCVITAKRIGENVTIHQGVTIGKSHKTGDVPIIGNNVVIFPNATVVGGVTIGDNVYIGANTFVSRDVPPNSTVKALEPYVCLYNGDEVCDRG